MIDASLGGLVCFISGVYVDPSTRGKGVWKKLLETIQDRASRVDNCMEYRLIVHNSNELAINVYDRTGFGPEAGLHFSQVYEFAKQ